jgi:hypothetical protein
MKKAKKKAKEKIDLFYVLCVDELIDHGIKKSAWSSHDLYLLLLAAEKVQKKRDEAVDRMTNGNVNKAAKRRERLLIPRIQKKMQGNRNLSAHGIAVAVHEDLKKDRIANKVDEELKKLPCLQTIYNVTLKESKK